MHQPLTDPDTFKRWTFGNVSVTRVLDAPPLPTDPAMFIQTGREEILRHRDWLYPAFSTVDGDIILHFQAFIVEADGKRIIVDPCIGNDKQRDHPLLAMRDSPFLERLATAGYPRESIDLVLCTHMHVDHCGWNTMLVDGEWVPTFPNARYLFSKTELEHAARDRTGDAEAIYQDSIKPIIEAGLADLVDPDFVVSDCIRLEPTPGHTAGHYSVLISSEGMDAIIAGDVLHHPIQAALPHVSSNFCSDCEVATVTRRGVLDRAAQSGAVMFGAHFGGPTGVLVRADGDAWKVEEA